ncbi:NUDIX domain-containing protein [Cellulomonas carbonis]|uniref:DNA mismatch repair protein MutT n=1 Tax=Cellulomonas carbonis T26 TaxID=947969 RepID=A0A0A0BRE9_9CELL|nr:NUDIX domain-containing protein [Cellulomonas carbonis]KGM11048.1 DNA mismatch repair protein MutT [Cellulomonas carbonis T26]GGB99467.1 DNA mismatch repair protein MutT [Cellulomonas carbonis]
MTPSGGRSAGLLPFRRTPDGVEVFVGHMGGPFWRGREAGAWTVLKGEHGDDEPPLAAAEREFVEETGLPVPAGPRIPLGSVRQRAGKTVTAWAVEAELDPQSAVSGTFPLEWPRGSGRVVEVPEVDRYAWLSLTDARRLLVAAQAELVDRLVQALAGSHDDR